MLTTRSKVLITVAAGYGLAALIVRALKAGVWNPEPEAQDWYTGWILLGILIVVTVASILADIRRSHTP